MKPISIITHDGAFHADDVFAVATVILSLPSDIPYEIKRTRDKAVIAEADYVVDVGGVYDPKNNRFDHHQEEGAGVRENKIPYASFGLVWKKFGVALTSSEVVARALEEKIVMPIDALDNGFELNQSSVSGIRPYTISDYLYSYWTDEDTNPVVLDRIFARVVSMARDLLRREMDKSVRIAKDEEKVIGAYLESKDKRIIILDAHLAWGRVLVEKPEPLIVVYPALDGIRWHAKTVALKKDSFSRRVLFPETWAGKTDKELQKLTGVSDAYFCHRGRFLAVSGSKEGALALAKKAIE